jgi:regulator of sigma E protease
MISVLHSIFWLLVLLGVMILIHELGHFLVARFFDVRVDIFSIGFGPRLFGFKRGDTDYRFSVVLFGGYVKMAGDQPGDEHVVNDPGAFLRKPRWQRLLIVFAGPFFNIALAVALLTGLFMVHYEHVLDMGGFVVGHVDKGSAAEKAGVLPGDKIIQIEGQRNPTWEDIVRHEVASPDRKVDVTLERQGKLVQTAVYPVLDERLGVATAGWESSGPIVIHDVTPGMPADKAGLKPGDLLISVNGQPIRSPYKLQEIIRGGGPVPAVVQYSRNGVTRSLTMTPVMGNVDGKPHYMIGVAPSIKYDIVTEQLSLPAALRESIVQNSRTATLIFQFLRGILERKMSAKALDGPIGIARESSRAAARGAADFLTLMAAVSINLAIVNMLPIPILDGGVILTLLIEMLLGRDLSNAFKEGLMKVGFVFLMAIVVFALYNDISKVFTQG